MSREFSVHHVAHQILEREGSHAGKPRGPAEATCAACTQLCRHFARLVGDSGCDLLMTRALSRAAAEQPALRGLRWRCGDPGTLEGLSARLADQSGDQAVATCAAIIAAFLSLLSRFIGEDLTRRQLERAWPDLQTGDPATESRE